MSQDLRAQVEANIAALQRAIDAAKVAVKSQHASAVFSWVEEKVTGQDPDANIRRLDNIDKVLTEPWRRRGRELANGDVYQAPDSQATMDAWVRTGAELIQAVNDIVQIDVDATLSHIVVGTIAATAHDTAEGVKNVAGWMSKLAWPAAIIAVVVGGYLVYRKVA
jgi:hypothetical protein